MKLSWSMSHTHTHDLILMKSFLISNLVQKIQYTVSIPRKTLFLMHLEKMLKILLSFGYVSVLFPNFTCASFLCFRINIM